MLFSRNFGKRIRQRQTNRAPNCFRVSRRQSNPLQPRLEAGRNPLGGIGEGVVEVEQNRAQTTMLFC